MRRLILVGIALALVLVDLRGPRWWGPFSGHLQFAGSWDAGNAAAGSPLPLIPVSQYQGLADDAENCGPASVAAILRWLRPDVAGGNTADLVARVRADTGETGGGTTPTGLQRALDAFGVSSAPLFAGDAPDGSNDPMAALRLALEHGRPVLTIVRSGDLRGVPSDTNHWVVVTGLEPQTDMVDIVDPAISADWQVNGNVQMPSSTLRTAMQDTGIQGGFDGMVVGAQRAGLTPSFVFIPVAGFLFVLGVLPTPRRRRFS